MCRYCNLEAYVGEDLLFKVMIDGTKQHFNIYLLNDVQNEQFSLKINGTFTEIVIKVQFCPMCGKQLKL